MAFAARKPALVRNPESVRPWQHVMDPLAGYLALAERLHDGGREFARAWNFGPPFDHECPVSELADTLARLWGEGANWKRDPDEKAAAAPEEPELRLDSRAASMRLGWRARIPLTPALESVVRFHKGFASSASARALVENDLQRFYGSA
jgi:CDP-glucose 4,6-dehydratase